MVICRPGIRAVNDEGHHHRTAGTTRNCPADHGAHRRQGRAKWRRLQARSVVRDAPTEAAEALRALGYTVTAPQAGEADRIYCFARRQFVGSSGELEKLKNSP
jgi:hypothetical protein